MPIYKVTVAVRGVMTVEAATDAEAGTIAYDYLDGCVKSGRVVVPLPQEIGNVSCSTFVQAAMEDRE